MLNTDLRNHARNAYHAPIAYMYTYPHDAVIVVALQCQAEVGHNHVFKGDSWKRCYSILPSSLRHMPEQHR